VECRKLPSVGSRAENQPQTILGRFMCNFMRFDASFTALNSCPVMELWKIHTSFYWPLGLNGLMFPFNFFGVSDTPNLNFWGWLRHWRARDKQSANDSVVMRHALQRQQGEDRFTETRMYNKRKKTEMVWSRLENGGLQNSSSGHTIQYSFIAS